MDLATIPASRVRSSGLPHTCIIARGLGTFEGSFSLSGKNSFIAVKGGLVFSTHLPCAFMGAFRFTLTPPRFYTEFMTHKNNNPRGWNRMEELVLNESFLASVEHVRSMNEFVAISAIPHLLKDYKLPSGYYQVVANYVEKGELDKSLFGAPLRIDSTEGVALQLSFDATQSQVVDYIKSRWGSEIAPIMESKFGTPSRVNSTQNPQAHRAAYDAYLNRKALGKTAVDVAADHNMSKSQLYKIIAKQKRPH